jgi:uncharacterized protein YecT (DUF1311 family)
MTFCRRTLSGIFPCFLVALGIQLLLSNLTASAGAQQPDAASQDAPSKVELAVPPSPVAFQNTVPASELTFLNSYAGRPTDELTKDKQFKNLIKKLVPNTTYHYGTDMSLEGAIDEVLHKSEVPVEIMGGRYLIAAGNRGPYLGGAGFYWIDLQAGIILGGFYFHPTNGEPTPTLTIFSRQLQDKFLSMSQFPAEFSAAVSSWSAAFHIPPVTAMYFIPNNGKKYVLIHDEDFCGESDGGSMRAANACSQMNVQAADLDMNAAYFMKETNNAANATAWMLEPDQIDWLQLRDRSCLGPNLFVCRVVMTRQRTRVLIGHSIPAPRPHPIGPRR